MLMSQIGTFSESAENNATWEEFAGPQSRVTEMDIGQENLGYFADA